MMLAAPIFLEMSKKGQLDCDIWLVHLTGEEFPADCLGARHLTQALIEGRLMLQRTDGKKEDLSKTRIQGVYVSDMIAHNNDRDRDVFQIAPGVNRASMWLAEQAHIATAIWNASVPAWNQGPDRVGRPRGRRSPDGAAMPETAPHLALNGQVRPVTDPRSTLYNTDGQIFSDAGVPASCSWRTTTSIATAITTRTTRWRTSIWITARRWRRLRSSRWPERRPGEIDR